MAAAPTFGWAVLFPGAASAWREGCGQSWRRCRIRVPWPLRSSPVARAEKAVPPPRVNLRMQTGQEELSFGAPSQRSNNAATVAADATPQTLAIQPRQSTVQSAAAGAQGPRHRQPRASEQSACRELTSEARQPAECSPHGHSSVPGRVSAMAAALVGRCTCVCVDAMPMCGGLADGAMLFWRWRRTDVAMPPAAAAPARPG